VLFAAAPAALFSLLATAPTAKAQEKPIVKDGESKKCAYVHGSEHQEREAYLRGVVASMVIVSARPQEDPAATRPGGEAYQKALDPMAGRLADIWIGR
jgi:hypothetical protein